MGGDWLNSGFHREIEVKSQFTTERLVVQSWVAFASAAKDQRTLMRRVVEILQPEVTKDLPPDWQGIGTESQAEKWIADRLAESSFFSILLRPNEDLVGFLILNCEAQDATDQIELRLGYLLSKETWGKGLGTELIAGLVKQCESMGDVTRLAGGVDTKNIPSIKVLERNGFVLSQSEESSSEMRFYIRDFS